MFAIYWSIGRSIIRSFVLSYVLSFLPSFIHSLLCWSSFGQAYLSKRAVSHLAFSPTASLFCVQLLFRLSYTNQWRRPLHVCVSYRLDILWFSEQTEPEAAVVALSADRLRQSLRNPVSIVARLIDRPHHWSVTKYKRIRIIRRIWIGSAVEGYFVRADEQQNGWKRR